MTYEPLQPLIGTPHSDSDDSVAWVISPVTDVAVLDG